MRFRDGLLALVALSIGGSAAGAVSAQDAVPPTTTAPSAASDPEWWVFSRSEQRSYLLDVGSIAQTGDELTVKVARVARQGAAADYSHTEDLFGLRCGAREARVELSTEVLETGERTEAYVTDEPWAAIRPDSLDEGAHLIACEGNRPPGRSFSSVKAYIDAGRP